jgi:aminopeptidase N
VKGGPKYFDEILRSYEGIVKGNLAGGFSKFNRPYLIERSSTQRNRLGPIGHGWRASTNDIPAGYTIQTYHKGPLVVHMLRMFLSLRGGSDDVFVKTMRDFLKEHDGKAASTEDFRRVLERNAGSDFGWFFDAWIYGAEIPTFLWDYTVKQEGDAYMLTLDLERRDVSDGFVTAVPLRVEFDGGKFAYVFLPSKSAKETFTRKLPGKPKNVVFAPDSSLLANVKRK